MFPSKSHTFLIVRHFLRSPVTGVIPKRLSDPLAERKYTRAKYVCQSYNPHKENICRVKDPPKPHIPPKNCCLLVSRTPPLRATSPGSYITPRRPCTAPREAQIIRTNSDGILVDLCYYFNSEDKAHAEIPQCYMSSDPMHESHLEMRSNVYKEVGMEGLLAMAWKAAVAGRA